jgi:type VI secretion system protein ImpF
VAELTLHDRLQPALLDRLLDEERVVAKIRITAEHAALERLSLPAQALVDILCAQGLTLQARDPGAERLELLLTAPRSRASPSQLRGLLVRSAGAPEGVALQTFAAVEIAFVRNTELEPAERRVLSRQRLRECVLRDLQWLFNSLSLDASQDLDALPEVERSVLNYGLPPFAGRDVSAIDALEAAGRLRRAVEYFEPRLRGVRVTPRSGAAGKGSRGGGDGTLELTLEAELWGQPVSQQLTLRTRIDTLSGDVSVLDGPG